MKRESGGERRKEMVERSTMAINLMWLTPKKWVN